MARSSARASPVVAARAARPADGATAGGIVPRGCVRVRACGGVSVAGATPPHGRGSGDDPARPSAGAVPAQELDDAGHVGRPSVQDDRRVVVEARPRPARAARRTPTPAASREGRRRRRRCRERQGRDTWWVLSSTVAGLGAEVGSGDPQGEEVAVGEGRRTGPRAAPRASADVALTHAEHGHRARSAGGRRAARWRRWCRDRGCRTRGGCGPSTAAQCSPAAPKSPCGRGRTRPARSPGPDRPVPAGSNP